MPRTKLRQGQTQTSKEEGGSTSRTTAQIEKYYSGGKRPFTYKKNDRGKVIKVELKGGGMSSGQAKIAAKAPPPNKIDAKDFAVLRAEKAKGRGMGLQDESIQPGKVQKAVFGKIMNKVKGVFGLKKKTAQSAPGGTVIRKAGMPIDIVAEIKKAKGLRMGGVMKAKRGTSVLSEKATSKTFRGYSKPFEGPTNKGRVSTIVGVRPGAKIKGQRKKFKTLEEMRKAKGFKPGESASEFNKRRMALSVAKKAAKATTVGKIALGVATAGVAAQQYLKGKMKKKKDVKKKMGGGMMMQRPMGYKTGGATGRAALSPSKSKDVADLSGKRRDKYKVLSKTRVVTPSGKVKPVRKTPIISSSRTSSRQSDGTYKITRFSAKAHDQKNSTEPTKFKDIDSRVYGLSKGGGMDTGRVGEMKSRIAVAVDRLKKAKKFLGRGSDPIKRNMGGMMMQRPMGYSKGVSVKARGCKLGRNKPTKIT